MDKTENTRTSRQNKSLHLWFKLLADSLNDAGLDMKKVLKPEINIPWNDATVKSYLWKPLMKAMLLKESTTEMNTTDMTKIHDVITLHIGEKFGVEVPALPSFEQIDNYLSSIKN